MGCIVRFLVITIVAMTCGYLILYSYSGRVQNIMVKQLNKTVILQFSKLFVRSSQSSTDLYWIDKNSVFRNFNITAPSVRKNVTILIIVSTAPRRSDRRQAIRETWWQDCKKTGNVSQTLIFVIQRLKNLLTSLYILMVNSIPG